MNSDFSELIEYLDGKFLKIDKRFEKIDERFEKVDQRFEKVDIGTEETRRHFDIVAEDLMSSMRQIAEGVSTNSDLIERLTSRVNSVEEQVDQLQGMRVSIETMREDIGHIRLDIAGINGKLSKTPSYEDLAAIEKRVWRLEQKLQS